MRTVARRATRNDLGDGGWTGTVLMERRGPIAGVRASPCLVFFREPHGEDARRDRRIGGIGRGQLQACVVVVDLPEAADVTVLDNTEGAFAVRVVVLVEVVERANSGKNQTAPLDG